VIECPYCGALMADSGWYVEVESDIICGKCERDFNVAGNVKDRIVVRIILENGEISRIEPYRRV